MDASCSHVRRYASWALYGAALGVVAIFLLLSGNTPLLLISAAIGSGAFVLMRALIGAVTGWPADVADRAFAVAVKRFIVGAFAGFILLVIVYIVSGWVSTSDPALFRRVIPHGFVSLPASGAAWILAEWAARRRSWLFVPLAWAVFFTAFAGLWVILTD